MITLGNDNWYWIWNANAAAGQMTLREDLHLEDARMLHVHSSSVRTFRNFVNGSRSTFTFVKIWREDVLSSPMFSKTLVHAQMDKFLHKKFSRTTTIFQTFVLTICLWDPPSFIVYFCVNYNWNNLNFWQLKN